MMGVTASPHIHRVSRCPDMEGIETRSRCNLARHGRVSRCPDMEGIETTIAGRSSLGPGTCVSRCPDMEGIETHLACSQRKSIFVSVGAPTWRGLKRWRWMVGTIPTMCQ